MGTFTIYSVLPYVLQPVHYFLFSILRSGIVSSFEVWPAEILGS